MYLMKVDFMGLKTVPSIKSIRLDFVWAEDMALPDRCLEMFLVGGRTILGVRGMYQSPFCCFLFPVIMMFPSLIIFTCIFKSRKHSHHHRVFQLIRESLFSGYPGCGFLGIWMRFQGQDRYEQSVLLSLYFHLLFLLKVHVK